MGLQKPGQDRRETTKVVETWGQLEGLMGRECWEAIVGGGGRGVGVGGARQMGAGGPARTCVGCSYWSSA